MDGLSADRGATISLASSTTQDTDCWLDGPAGKRVVLDKGSGPSCSIQFRPTTSAPHRLTVWNYGKDGRSSC